MRTRAFCVAAVVVLSCVTFAAAQNGGYSIIKKIPIPGSGSWDYLTVDPSARRLYVSHGTQVEVVDIDSLSVVGNIPKTPGVHGIAIAPEFGRGFISNGQSSTVTIFDLKTLKPIAESPPGKNLMRSSMISPRNASSHLTAVATVQPRLMLKLARSQAPLISEGALNLPQQTERATSLTIWKMRISF